MALLDGWALANARVHSLQGMAKVKVKAVGRSLGGTQVLLAETPDHLRAETLSPFGAPLLLLTSDGQSLAALLPSESRFYSGAATAANLQRFTRVPIGPAELVGILLYRAPVINYQRAQAYALPEDGWQLELSGGDQRQELVFDQGRRLIETRYYRGGRLELRVAYDRFDDAAFPREFILELPEAETTASLVFTELSTNRDFLPGIFQLVPPAGVQAQSLDDIL